MPYVRDTTVWTADQIAGAKKLWRMECNPPKCPREGCKGTTDDAPETRDHRCPSDEYPEDCAVMDLMWRQEDERLRVEKESGLPSHWRFKMSFIIYKGPLPVDVVRKCMFLEEQPKHQVRLRASVKYFHDLVDLRLASGGDTIQLFTSGLGHDHFTDSLAHYKSQGVEIKPLELYRPTYYHSKKNTLELLTELKASIIGLRDQQAMPDNSDDAVLAKLDQAIDEFSTDREVGEPLI